MSQLYSSALTIRPAVSVDADALKHYLDLLYEENPATLYRKSQPVLQTAVNQMITDAYNSQQMLLLIAQCQQRVIGMLDMQKIRRVQRSHCAEIGMSVLKDFRGQGIGRSLLLYALNWAAQSAIKRVELEVFATNTAAIKLYNAQGFVEEGRKIGAVSVEDRWVDLIQMVYSRVL